MASKILFFCLSIRAAFSQAIYTDVFPHWWRTPDGFNLTCPDGWTARGPECFRVYSERLSWYAARQTCRNLQGHLAKVDDMNKNIHIGELAKASGVIDENFWIGLTLEGSAGTDNASWSDGTPTKTVIGRWGSGQPDLTSGSCTSVTSDPDKQYPWQLERCHHQQPFVCELRACLPDEKRCGGGRCFLASAWCDGVDDCGDGIDESDCLGQCSYLVTNSSENIKLETYTNEKSCQWLIIGPVGKAIHLNFSRISTEETADYIQLFAGGSSVATSKYIGHVSGEHQNLYYASPNNYMLVRFSSDASQTDYGFTASWTAVDINEEVIALNEVPMRLTSPNYPGSYPRNSQIRWLVKSDRFWEIISLTLSDCSLGDEDMLRFYDGRDETDRIISNFTGNRCPGTNTLIQSTSSTLLVLLNSRSSNPGKFQLYIERGCRGSFNESYGEIMSPGFGKVSYPILQTCTWAIDLPTGIKYSIIFTQAQLGAGDSIQIEVPAGVESVNGTKVVSVEDGPSQIKFKSDAVDTNIGFYAEYSIDCPDITWDDNSIKIDGAYSSHYQSNYTVYCQTGFYFIYEENGHCSGSTVNENIGVEMVCKKGGAWNRDRIPQCHEVSCGSPDPIDNGFIVNVTAVTFGGKAQYECYSGFNMTGGGTSTCLQYGNWSQIPACQARYCGSPPEVPGSSMVYLEGSSTTYGSVLNYTCDMGYFLSGGLILGYCTESGSWSNEEDPPVCDIVTCLAPEMHHGETSPPAGSSINYKATIGITCSTGFKTNQTSPVCQETGELSEPPLCQDINECVTSSPCKGPSTCVNVPGAFTCPCEEGFTLDSDNVTCVDIEECTQEKGGCEGSCVESEPGYDCNCSGGQVLFDADGKNGVNIPAEETGLEVWNIFHVNHSCIAKVCPSLPNAIPNSDVSIYSTAGAYHYVGDVVDVHCDVGYHVNGSSEANVTMICQEEGTWSLEVPACVPEYCSPVDISSSTENPPELSNPDAVRFGENVSMICRYPDGTEQTRVQKCVYHRESRTYRLEGEPIECQVTHCPPPNGISGIENSTLPVSPGLVNDTFAFICKSGFVPEGESQTTLDTSVTCQSNGRWDLGSLRCTGPVCGDPGRPSDGKQKSTSYEEGNEVTFTCDKSGYEPHPDKIRCEVNGADAAWSDPSNPECRDEETPALYGCPPADIELYRYESVVEGFARMDQQFPNVTDNSGMVKSFNTNLNANDAVSENITLTWIAKDFRNNTNKCLTNIIIKDYVYPVIESCQRSKYIYLYNETDTLVIAPLPLPGTTLLPSSEAVDQHSLYKAYDFISLLEDGHGFNDTCHFQQFITPRPCSEWSLRTPQNGEKSCRRTGDSSLICNLTCNANHTFVNTADYIQYTCQDGEPFYNHVYGFINETQAPECVESFELMFTTIVTMNYSFENGVNQTINGSAFADALQSANFFNDADTLLTTLCKVSYRTPETDDYLTILPDIPVEKHGEFVIASVSVQFQDDPSNSACSYTVFDAFERATDYSVFENIYNITVEGEYWVYQNGGGVSEGIMCPYGHLTRNNTAGVRCIPSPPGYHVPVDGDALVPCPRGEYSTSPGRWECQQCPPGTSTLWRSSQSAQDCIDKCVAPLYSGTGLPLCEPVPNGTYWTSPSSYSPCPGDSTTLGSHGVAREEECVASCSAGWFSATGYEPCLPCPVGFYQVDRGQYICQECDLGFSTVSKNSTTAADCSEDATSFCGMISCENEGNCTIAGHTAMCVCPEEYTGSTCETLIDHCASDPCYYNGTCTPVAGGYTCACLTGYTGAQCETEPQDCTASTCNNGGKCKDEIDDFTCLCLSATAFTGKRCESPTSACEDNKCDNGAECRNISTFSYQCDCKPGYTGQYCQTDIDDCFGEPCMHGSSCNDGINSFTCNCADNYSGRLCESRLETLCDLSAVDCGGHGRCMDLFHTWSTQCVCETGYQLVTNTCVEIDECDSNPCQNGAPCSDQQADYKCDCSSGYEGKNCQHDIDDCAGTPCLNGTCADLVDGYNCSCYSGFTGRNCETDVDECENSTCMNGACVDKIDGFICECQPGYTGTLCQTDIDDCSSSPCYNGANCTDGIDEYICTCTEGWEGLRCLTPVTTCSADLCANGAVCYNLFQDFYCACIEGFAGRNCTVGQTVCDIYNPCDNGGSCVTNRGVATCNCADDYAGKNCECLGNPCSSVDQCLNGGTCSITTDSNFTCSCITGYTGYRCETNVDECADISCNKGECVDGVGEALCKCDPGYSGKRCNVGSDRNFDVLFEGAGNIKLSSPYVINCSQFSLALAFKHCPPNHFAGSLISVNVKEFGGQSYFRFIDWNKQNITINLPLSNGEFDRTSFTVAEDENPLFSTAVGWHYGVLAVDLIRQFVTVGFENSIQEMTFPLSSNLERLIGSFSVTVGGEWSEEPAYLGQISHVQTWCSLIQFKHDTADQDAYQFIEGLIDNLDEENLLSDWSPHAWEVHGRVTRLFPSQKDVIGGGNTCTGRVTQAPSKTCQQKRFGEVVINQVVSVPFTQQGFNLRNRMSGDYFSVGVSQIYESDDVGSSPRDSCSFNVYGRMSECADPDIPIQGNLSNCVDDPEILTRRCSYTCSSGFSPISHAPLYQICGPSGVWDPRNPYRDYLLPSCGAISERKKDVKFGWSFTGSILWSYPSIWQEKIVVTLNTKPSLSTLCSQPAGCTGAVMFSDAYGTGESKTVNVSISIPLAPSKIGETERKLDVEKAIIEALFLDEVFFDMVPNSGTLIPAIFDTDSFWIETNDACEEYYQPINNQCVQCTPGTFYNRKLSMCTLCEKSTYQELAGQGICTSCGTGKTTAGPGAKHRDECIDICMAGEFHNQSSSRCDLCPIGYYQEREGQIFCDVCPPGKTTRFTGVNNRTFCSDDCPDGYQMVGGGLCKLCPVGRYREQRRSVNCLICPTGSTTKDAGASLVTNCSRVLCEVGLYRIGDDPGVCAPCAIGSYRNETMENCTLCGQNMRTDANASKSRSDCKFYCPGGSYIDAAADPSACLGCPNGAYKEEKDYYLATCHTCPGKAPRTKSVNSTLLEDCWLMNCTSGHFINETDQCEPCPRGHYQPLHWQYNCTQCPDNMSTYRTGSTDLSECKKSCPSGKEFVGGSCEDCGVGFYKDNTQVVWSEFSPCTMCDPANITETTGSTLQSDCSVENCTSGYRVVNKQCELCPEGSYQDEWWKPSCKSCPVESTTQVQGAKCITDCDVYPNRTSYMFRVRITNVVWVADFGRPTSLQYTLLKARTEAVISHVLEEKAKPVYKSKTAVIAFGFGSVIASISALADSTMADPTTVIKEALLEVYGTEIKDPFKKYEPLILEDLQTPVVEAPASLCEYGTTYNLRSGVCGECPDQLFQTPDLVDLCIPCPDGKSPINKTGTEQDNCQSPCDKIYRDENNQTQSHCLNGGICVYDSKVQTYSCLCPDTYQGERCMIYIERSGKQWIYFMVFGLFAAFILFAFGIICVMRIFRGRQPLKEETGSDPNNETEPENKYHAFSDVWNPFYKDSPMSFPNVDPSISRLNQELRQQKPTPAVFDTNFKAPVLPTGGSRSGLSMAAGGTVVSHASMPGYQPMGVQYPTYSTIGDGAGPKYLFWADKDDTAQLSQNVKAASLDFSEDRDSTI